MPNRSRRITNGQRGALCALMLCGEGFFKALAIVGAPAEPMRAVLPPDWHVAPRKRWKWRGEALKAAERAWRAGRQMEGVHRDMLRHLAKAHGWERAKLKPGPSRCPDKMRDQLAKVIGVKAAQALYPTQRFIAEGK